MSLEQGASELILSQIALVRRLQEETQEAIARNDWQNAQRLISTIHEAFSTFTEGITKMAIDVSNLKNVLTGQAAVTPDTVKQLSDRLTAIEEKVQQDEVLKQDVADLKEAIASLNDAAKPAAVLP